MDLGLAVGLLVAFVSIVVGNMLEHGEIGDMVGGPAALIVFGGTFGSLIVNSTNDVLKECIKWFGRLMRKPAVDPPALIEEIVELATRARREGILGLEKLAPNVSDPFLSRALMMAIDGADSNTIRGTMEISMSQEESQGTLAAKALEAAGGYAPTIGIIGAVLGLIQVMKNLDNMEMVGKGIASAFVATIYGVGVANILLIPMGSRIRTRLAEGMNIKEMMLQGVLAIQEGTNPKLVRDRLRSFLKESERGDETE
jgi:chemotaxis protein MotA